VVLGIETKGRSIEEIDATLARPALIRSTSVRVASG